MAEIPEELARAIQAGDCVLWVGAGFGSLAGRPGWEDLLKRLIPQCEESARHSLEELLEQGRLRTVLTYVHRHFGDEPLAQVLKEVADQGHGPIDDKAAKLRDLPWKACFATTYADIAREVFTEGDAKPDVLSHNDVHNLSLRADRNFFILRTPPTGRAMRTDGALFDLVEEVVRSRAILFLGFEPDDPDLAQVLDLLDRIGRANPHYAVLPYVSRPEAEEWKDRFAIEVIHVKEDAALGSVIDDVAEACAKVAVRPSDVQGRLAILDLTRALRGVDVRADLAVDDALTLGVEPVEQLLDALPGGSLTGVSTATLLRAGSVMLAHGRMDRARRCFQQVISVGAGAEYLNTARFNLALIQLAENDRTHATEGLSACAESNRSLAIVPPRFELREIQGRAGSQLMLSCRDRETKDNYDVAVSTLSRPVGGDEQAAFSEAVNKLTTVEHPAVHQAHGGFADGRLFGVMYEPTPGIALADNLDGLMSLEKAFEIVGPLIDGLEACHKRGVSHRNINPETVFIGPRGAMLRGFGFPPVVGHLRPSVRDANLGYMAPEVRTGGAATAAADAYSLTALLYRCLTGFAPSGSVPPPSTVGKNDARLDLLLQGGLHPDPDKRLPLGELKAQLENILNTPAVEAVPGKEEVIDVSRMPAEKKQTVVPPQDPDDLEAWAWILERKPAHLEARQNIERIETESRQAGRWDRVAEVLTVRAQHAQIQHERVDLLRELIDTFENKLSAPANAFESMQMLVEEVDVETQLSLMGELKRLAELTGQWAQLADSLLIVAERATDPAQQAELYTELGEVYAGRLGANDRAVVAYEQATELESTPDRVEATVPLYRKLGRHAELAAALLSLADKQTGEERLASLFGAAKVLRDELGDEEAAFGTLEILLAEDPEHPDALEMGESVARQLERWEQLVSVLARRADATLDTGEASQLRREAADTALDQLGRPDLAVEQLTKIIEADRADRDAALKLAELLREAVKSEPGRRPVLIDALGVLIDLEDTPEQKAGLLAENAHLLDQEPDGRERAVDCREQLLDTLPLDRDVCQEAATALERVYRRAEDFPRLEAMLLRQGQADDADEGFRARAWEKVLELRRGPLEERAGEIEALEALTSLEPAETRWRDQLLVRYLDVEEYKKAGPLIRAQVFDEKDPKRKAELLLRGGILREQIGKIEGAVEALEEAVSLDPSLIDAWLALRDLYAEHDQPLKAVEALVSAAENHTNRVERTKMLFEASKNYLHDLDRPGRAAELLEKVVDLDPDHREATGLLLDRLMAEGDLKRAWPHAQTFVMQVRSQAASDHGLNLRALAIAGRCALAAEATDKAREYLEKAKTLDATNLDVLRLLADLDMDAEQWQDALRNYQSVVLGVGSKLPPRELSRLYVRMADARIGMDEKPKAVQMAERALDIDPDNEDAITKLIDLGAEVGGPAAVIKAKRRLVESLERREEGSGEDVVAQLRERRVALLHEIADTQIADLKMPFEAVGTLERVLQLLPNDPAVMHKILDVFTEGKRWRDAVNVLDRLADAQLDDVVRAKYLYAGAVILKDNLADHRTASDWMQRVMAADPLHGRGFDLYAEHLTKARRWEDLTKVIRTHLKALPRNTEPARFVSLFETLGGAYEHMKDLRTALAAYDQAARLAPRTDETEAHQRDRREKVMRLAVQVGDDQLDKAIDHGHAIIASQPMEFEVYHRLVELYLKQGHRDRARALARTLKFLKQADEAELELADSAGGPGEARGTISREFWRRALYHPMEDPHLSDLLSIIWPMVAAREGRTHDHRAVNRSSRTDVTLQSPEGLARYVAHACQVLDVPVPDLYLRDDEAGGIVIDALSDPENAQKRMVYPSVLAGKDALGDHSSPGLKFRAGRAVARARPEHILASVLPSAASVRHAVYGAVRVTAPEVPVPEDAASASEAYKTQIEPFLQPARLEQLKMLTSGLRKNGEVDARSWVQGVTYTATRAGFVLCDSLDVAAQILTREGDEGSPISAKERIRDLIAYSVSEPYLKLRKELGMSR